MADLTGKVALVTGGSEGIGFGIASKLVEAGAQVIITGRRKAELLAAATALGAGVQAIVADIAKLTDIERLFAEIRASIGRVDIVVANAGVLASEPLGAISEAAYDLMFDINVKGTVFTVQGAVPLMPAGSSCILVSSIAGFKGMPSSSIYSATKAAIRSLARSWAVDLKGKNIRVNVVSPGLIDTPGLRRNFGEGVDAQPFLNQLGADIPVGRIGTMNDVGSLVCFLASTDADFITGADYQVDGGAGQI